MAIFLQKKTLDKSKGKELNFMVMYNSLGNSMIPGINGLDAMDYLNSPMQPMPFGCTNMLGGMKMGTTAVNDIFQPKKTPKVATKFDTETIKKVATAGVIAILAGVGICKGKDVVAKLQNSSVTESIGNAAKNFIAKFKK